VLGEGPTISVACKGIGAPDLPALVDLQVNSLVGLAPVVEQADDQSDAEEEEPHERPDKAELLGLDELCRGLRTRADLEARRNHMKELERDKEELLASYEILARESLGEFFPEDRNGLYRRLNLVVRVPRDGEPKLSADVDLTFSKNAETY